MALHVYELSLHRASSCLAASLNDIFSCPFLFCASYALHGLGSFLIKVFLHIRDLEGSDGNGFICAYTTTICSSFNEQHCSFGMRGVHRQVKRCITCVNGMSASMYCIRDDSLYLCDQPCSNASWENPQEDLVIWRQSQSNQLLLLDACVYR